MGEIAEDIEDGSCCDLCGQFFEHNIVNKETGKPIGIYCHGHQVTCWDCYDGLTEDEKEHHIRADVKTF